MPRKKHKPEEVVTKLRQIDVRLSQGRPVAEAIRTISDGVHLLPLAQAVRRQTPSPVCAERSHERRDPAPPVRRPPRVPDQANCLDLELTPKQSSLHAPPPAS